MQFPDDSSDWLIVLWTGLVPVFFGALFMFISNEVIEHRVVRLILRSALFFLMALGSSFFVLFNAVVLYQQDPLLGIDIIIANYYVVLGTILASLFVGWVIRTLAFRF